MTMDTILNRAADELRELLPKLIAMRPQLDQFGQMLMTCWTNRGKVLTAGNGGSATDAMHLAEELSVRFFKNRRALAAMALCDPSVITCAGNDFGFDSVFARQVEALGNAGDLLVVFSTSGNSANVLKCLDQARSQQLKTVGFLGKDGGKAKPLCDVALVVPATTPHRIQEGHKILYHAICEWIDGQVD
jgi:D-sedoheptulose 7-phosphate isomerase